jgi:hypothetical protein
MGLTPGSKPGTAGGFKVDGSGLPIIPHQLFDPDGVLYLNSGILPKPTAGASTPGYAVANVSNPIDVRDDIVRVDHNVTDKWHILGHYMHDSVTQGYAQPMLGWSSGSYSTITSTLSNPSNSAALKLSGTISPQLLVEASMNYDGNIINITDSKNSNVPSGWSVAPVTGSFAIKKTASPGMTFGTPLGTAEDPGSAPWHNAAEDYEPKLDVSYTTGKHAMKYGFSYNRYTKNQQIFGDEQGAYTFGSLTNDTTMDVLLGLSSGYSQYQATPIRHYVNQTPSAYVMDNWHATSRLTLQLGLRYDALPHAWERNNDVANFNPAAYLPSALPIWDANGTIDPASPGLESVNGVNYYLNGMGLAGVEGFPRGLVTNDYKTVQPRVGFSEDLSGNGKTVLRGGFGTFYERMQGNDIYNAATNPPFAYNLGLNNTQYSSPGTSWNLPATESGSPQAVAAGGGVPIFAASVTNLAPTYRAPAVAQFSIGVQREISPSVIWVIQYVGNLAWHQNIERNINTFPLSTPLAEREAQGDSGGKYPGDPVVAANANANALRTYEGYGGITQQENTTNGNYNGFQTGLRVQNRWGLSAELDYTYSHEIDLTSYDLTGVSNPFNVKYDKGSGALDRRNIVNANYVYKMPFFNKSTGFVQAALGGWELAGTIIDESGTIISNQGPGLSIPYDAVGLDGGYTNRPNVSGKVQYLRHFSEWFNVSQFSGPVPAWLGGPNQGFGNAGRDSIVGPGRVNFTTSLYKSFAVTERAHFELRFESFNTFNHFEFNGVSSNLGLGLNTAGTALVPNNNFGAVTSAWDPRTLELGAKFVF